MTETTKQHITNIGTSITIAVAAAYAMTEWTNARIDRDIDSVERTTAREIRMISDRVESLDRRITSLQKWPLAEE